jgi:hypothetical protein
VLLKLAVASGSGASRAGWRFRSVDGQLGDGDIGVVGHHQLDK